MEKVILPSEEATIAFGEKLGSFLQAGDLITMEGDLGAGKTAFTSGFARGLGYKGYVQSPTFALINEYRGDVMIYHFDVYRIDENEEMYDIGIDDYLFGDGVCIIEWAERIKDLLPENVINVDIMKDISQGEDFRKIVIRGGDRE